MYQLAARMGTKMAAGIADDTGFSDVLNKASEILDTDNESYCWLFEHREKKLWLHLFSFLTADLPSVSGASSPHALHHLRSGECQQRRDIVQEEAF